MNPMRPDEPEKVEKFEGAIYGGKALIVLGGPSAAGWEKLRAEIKPDVLIGVNGVNNVVENLDFYLLTENMNRTALLASRGDQRSLDFIKMLNVNNAKVRMISHRSINLVEDTSNVVSVRREGYETVPGDFTFRKYGLGFISGPVMKREGAWTSPRVRIRVGTVALQALHLAGILGCFEVHTIGYDLMFREKRHHWFAYPKYQADRFRTEQMFVDYKGIKTQFFWIETGQFLKTLEPVFARDKIVWRDHSDGLLKIEGLWSAL